ncbi:MAG TPA: hypothetical protein PKH31_03090 [Candidatus Sumerlaeota bacterium]|nr:hypothetical protein [Candidatus Sumerlaeota bacterium]
MTTPGHTIAPSHSHGLEIVDQALRAGKVQAATLAFHELAGQTSDPERFAQDLAHVLNHLFDDFVLHPLKQFLIWLRNHPAREMVEAALEPLEHALEGIAEWQKLLQQVAGERVAREIRTQVRARDLNLATSLAMRFLSDIRDETQREGRIRQLGIILGSMVQDRPRSETVVAQLGKQFRSIGYTAEHLDQLQETLATTHSRMSLTEMGEQERQWTLLYNEAVVTLVRRLPGPGGPASPQPADEQRFFDALRSVVAACFLNAEHQEQEESDACFIDLARILREFCPADERPTGTIEGIEAAAFLRLPPADKLISVRTIRRLGQNLRFCKTLLHTTERHRNRAREFEILLTLMGGLSNSVFAPCMAQVLEDESHKRIHDTIIDALGRIGDMRSLGALQKLFVSLCQARLIDPPTRNRLADCMASMGRIARHPGTSEEQRNQIVGGVFKALPSDRPTSRIAIQTLCSWNPGGLSTDVRRLIIPRAIDILWTVDAHSKLAKGNLAQKTELGSREQIATVLINMGTANLPLLIEEAEKRLIQYSGAYLALAEILTKIGDSRSLPLLQKMLLITLKTDDSATPEHLRESYFDGATNDFKPLSRDKIAHAIVFAIHKAGGPEGLRILNHFTQRIKSHEFDPPGGETMELLAKFLVSAGPLTPLGGPDSPVASSPNRPRPQMEVRPLGEPVDFNPFGESSPSGPLPPGPGFFGETEFGQMPVSRPPAAAPAPRVEEPRRAREDEPLKSLLKDIQGKGLFGVKIERRVSAIQEVGARRDPEALPALCEALEAKDRILASSAETAILEIVNPRAPLPEFRNSLFALFECMRGQRGLHVRAISQLIDRLRPEREPVKGLLLSFIEVETEDRLRKDVADLFRIANERLSRSGQSVSLGAAPPPASGGTAAGSGGGGTPASQGPKTQAEMLEAKRQYFAARKAWIAGGKRDPEPPRPPGV